MADIATGDRRGSTTHQDRDAQKAKKRAWDRAAQRKLREKNKTRMDHLEQTVRILQGGDQASKITELMDEIEKLRLENARLRSIMANSASLLQSAKLDSNDGNGKKGARTGQDGNVSDAAGSEGEQITIAERQTTEPSSSNHLPAAESTDPPLALGELTWPATTDGEATIAAMEPSILCDDFFAAFDFTTGKSPHWSDVMGPSQGTEPSTGPIIEPSMISTSKSHAPYHTGQFSGTIAKDTFFLDRFMPRTLSASTGWQMANRIFEKVFHVDVIDALAADNVDVGPLLKGIDLGWDVCGRACEQSPNLRILRQMDQYLWSELPKSNRAAIAYKSYMLIRYLLNPTRGNLLGMPEWERPIPLQRTTEHPVVIGFFPWPALRERLILNQEYYLNTRDFFARILTEFDFDWPYSYEHAFIVERHTGNYRATPTFVEHVRDLKSWTLRERFFDSFPELRSAVEQEDTAMS